MRPSEWLEQHTWLKQRLSSPDGACCLLGAVHFALPIGKEIYEFRAVLEDICEQQYQTRMIGKVNDMILANKEEAIALLKSAEVIYYKDKPA